MSHSDSHLDYKYYAKCNSLWKIKFVKTIFYTLNLKYIFSFWQSPHVSCLCSMRKVLITGTLVSEDRLPSLMSLHPFFDVPWSWVQSVLVSVIYTSCICVWTKRIWEKNLHETCIYHLRPILAEGKILMTPNDKCYCNIGSNRMINYRIYVY